MCFLSRVTEKIRKQPLTRGEHIIIIYIYMALSIVRSIIMAVQNKKSLFYGTCLGFATSSSIIYRDDHRGLLS